jgi:inner membrane protein
MGKMMIYGLLMLLIMLAILVGIGFLIYLLVRKIKQSNTTTMTHLEDQNSDNAANKKVKNINDTLTIRAIIVGVIAIVMLIPLVMMQGVVDERNGLYNNVLHDIATTWGGQQLLQGPILVVPFIEKHVSKETIKDESGKERIKTKTKYLTKYAIHLPKELNINVDLAEQHRKRGIYKSLVYEADLRLSGSFEKLDLHRMSEHIHRIDWEKAYLVLGLSDTRALNEVSTLNWNGEEVGYQPGTKVTELLGHGFHANLKGLRADAEKHSFHTKISINGSQGFRFAPFGENTIVDMTSSWPHPSFQGMTLPASHEITAEGFTSSWMIPHLARNYPQSWVYKDANYHLGEFIAGVDLFEPVFLYSKVTRAVKYGILFVGLTFLTFLIFELTTKIRLHYVQYGLIGVALTLFYLVLLSIAEHTVFLTAYVVAALINIGLITIYAGTALKNWQRAGAIFALLSALYAVLYSLLQLEDYALLMGTMLLLSVLAVLMYVTRNLRVHSPDSV